jgi:hypothetical protein
LVELSSWRRLFHVMSSSSIQLPANRQHQPVQKQQQQKKKRQLPVKRKRRTSDALGISIQFVDTRPARIRRDCQQIRDSSSDYYYASTSRERVSI